MASGAIVAVGQRTTSEQLLTDLFGSSSSDAASQFYLYNTHINPQSMLEPGSLIYHPDSHMCIDPEHTQEGLKELNKAYQDLSPEQRRHYHKLRPMLAKLDTQTDEYQVNELGEQWELGHEIGESIISYADSGRESLNKYLELTSYELKNYKQVYVNAMQQYGTLHHPDFYA